MLPSDWKKVITFNKSPEDILASREAGQVYSFNFGTNEGKYISSVFNSNDPIDTKIQISPKIEVRLTYIFKEDDIVGVQISKLNSNKVIEKIHLSTLDWDGVLKLLHIFKDLDAKAVASGSLILDKSIVSDPIALEKFLNTVASDPEGQKKLKEVSNNLKPGDLDVYSYRKINAELMDDLLNDTDFFRSYKLKNSIGKDEEIWQQFFTKNDWILGTDVIKILDDRVIDKESTVDLPVKSFDGFLDIVELKLPLAPFWTADIYPNAEVTKAIIQCMRYITEYERRFNDHKLIKELGVEILKPRITLIYGRSKEWDAATNDQFRVLNSSFHNIAILTYDHVLQRAEKLTGYKRKIR